MNEVKYAGFGIRFVASLLDTFFLALPLAVVIYIISGGEWFDFTTYQQNLQMAMSGNPHALDNQPTTSFFWETIFEISVLVVTIIFWEKFKGATPGKKIVNIKIVDADTLDEISNKQAITRSLGYIPSTLLFGLGFLMIMFTKRNQSLHDKLAHTVVIYT
ncbi:RDD family protein [Sulfurimonas sp. C5]|uniref:RDD family protein n=1 Tax=Sulfurimonas sp. C5 TaxID=3036947 RepID=UPI002456A8D8|nr:RDD family protein [Sulfurimonas sp. C5]MDH4943653.1 RDD family protein [Sulfurimonas sp. C5]